MAFVTVALILCNLPVTKCSRILVLCYLFFQIMISKQGVYEQLVGYLCTAIYLISFRGMHQVTEKQ